MAEENHPPQATGDAAEEGVQSSSSGSSVFFARVPPVVPVEEVTSLFSQFGKVLDTNLFRRWKTAHTSKGCGIITFAEAAAAAAAVKALNGKYKWPEGESHMVLEPMDPSKLRQQPEACQAAAKVAKHNISSSKLRGEQQQNKKARGVPSRARPAASHLQSVFYNTLLLPDSTEQELSDSCSSNPGFDEPLMGCSMWSGCNGQAMMAGAVPVHLLSDLFGLQLNAVSPSSHSTPLELDWASNSCNTMSSSSAGSMTLPLVASAACSTQQLPTKGLMLLGDVWTDALPADGDCCASLQQLQAMQLLGCVPEAPFLPQATLQGTAVFPAPVSAPSGIASGPLQLPQAPEWPAQQQPAAAGVQLCDGRVMPPVMIEVPDAAVAVVAQSMKIVQQASNATLNLVATSHGSVALQITGTFDSVQSALQLCSLAAV